MPQPARAAAADIVVGVDGSAASNAAVRWAAGEALLRGSALRLVHVAALPVITYVASSGAAAIYDWQDQQAARILAEGAALAHRVGHDAGGTVRCAAPETYRSAPVPTLVDVSKGADMIVVGSRGMGSFRRGLLGSVSTGLLHHAHCPVAIIHDGPVAARHLPVVLGVDGSPASVDATAIAFREAAQRGVDLVAVHAWSDTSLVAVPGVDWSAVAAGEHEVLAERLAGMADDYPAVSVRRVVVRDQPARYLAEQADNAQLLVVGSHGRGGFAGMLLGSVSTALAHSVSIPLIVARRS